MWDSALYRADAAVGSRDREGVAEMVAYQVNRRFVDNQHSIPDEIADVVYYSLAIGHHTGIIDCFEEQLRCPLELIKGLIEQDPDDGLAKKLNRAYSRGEVYIDKYDLEPLVKAVDERLNQADPYRNVPLNEIPLSEPVSVTSEVHWLQVFRTMLDVMMANWDASIILRRRGL